MGRTRPIDGMPREKHNDRKDSWAFLAAEAIGAWTPHYR